MCDPKFTMRCLVVLALVALQYAHSSSIESPQDCLKQSLDLRGVADCFRRFIILKGEIGNKKRFTQTLAAFRCLDDVNVSNLSIPYASQRRDYAAATTEILRTGKCPAALPTSLASDLECIIYASPAGASAVVLFERRTTRCIEVDAAWKCSKFLPDSKRKFKRGWGVLMAATADSAGFASQVHLSAAHPISDGTVDLEVASLFESVPARSGLIQGARRDAFLDKALSICQGSYYPGDAAHDNRTMFHHANLAIMDWQLGAKCGRNCAFVQFHGKAVETCPDNDAFLSVGVKPFTKSGKTLSAAKALYEDKDQLISRLVAAIEQDAPFRVQTPLSDKGKCFLGGTTNVLGRRLNGVPAERECATAAKSTGATGHFIQVEQEPATRDRIAEWTKIFKAALAG